MVEAMKNNESESESVKMNAKTGDDLSKYIGYHAERQREAMSKSMWRAIEKLQNKIRELEAEVEALQRGDNTGFKHENDGGWFE